MALPWWKIAGPLVLVAIIFGAGYQVASWRWSGRVEKAVSAKEAAVKERDAARALELQWRADIMATTERLREIEAQNARLDILYQKAVERPPEVVIEYRDRIKTVTEVIQSEDCVEGLGELFTFINDLPERPQ